MMLTDHVSTAWNSGRGKNTNFIGKDIFFKSLCVIKHGQQWEFMARAFKLSFCTLERQVTEF